MISVLQFDNVSEAFQLYDDIEQMFWMEQQDYIGEQQHQLLLPNEKL